MSKDIYPILVREPKSLLTFDNLFKALLIIAVIILWYKTCNPPKPVLKTLQPVTSVGEQKEVVKIINQLSDFQRDSVNKIIGTLETVAATAIFDRDNAQAQNVQLTNEMNDLLTTPDIPDTCKQIVSSLQAQFKKVSASTQAQINACSTAVKSQNEVISNKNKIIAIDKNQIGNLNATIDSAFKQQQKLQANIKKLNPKSELYISATAIGSPEKYLAAYGVGIGFMNKQHTQIEITAFQMKSQVFYSLSIKKPLFHF